MDPQTQTIIIQSVTLLLLILFSAFFSSAETAYVSVNEIQIQLLADEGNKRAIRAKWILDRNAKMLSAILVGNNIVNIAASALTTTMAINLFGNAYVGAATGLLTLVILLFGEITPKSAATAKALTFALLYSAPIKAIIIVLTPIVILIGYLRRFLLRLLGIDPNASDDVMTEDELKTLVDVGYKEGAIENDEFQMITNIFSLDDQLARDIMVPRADIVFIPADISYEDLQAIHKENTFTRYPVYTDDINTVIGVINMKDLLFFDPDTPFSVRRILREPHFTFEHKEVGTLLMEMRENSVNMTIVLDEYGTTSGLITLEDILEEIVGEIRDEYDNDEKDDIIALKNGKEFLINGSTNLDDVNEVLHLHLTSEEYDSIGGYMIEKLDRLPKSGEVLTLESGTKVIAAVVSHNRIEKVHIVLPVKNVK